MPKKTPESFKSIQILSAKAQSLWAKAKQRMQTPKNEPRSGHANPLPDEEKPVVFIDIEEGTVMKATLSIIAVVMMIGFLFLIRDKLLLLFLSCFLAIVVDAHVRRLEKWGVPRGVAVLILYLIFLGVAVFLIASLIPIVASQVQDFARVVNNSADAFILNPHVSLPFVSEGVNQRLSELVQTVLGNLGIKDRASALMQFGQSLSTVATSSIGLAVQIAGSVFNFMLNMTLILVLAFFIQIEREKVADLIRSLLPHDYRSYFDAKAEAIHHKMAQWFQGQLILCFSIGVLVFIALEIVGMPYALTLALLAAFTEFIPYAGPLIGALPAIFIALTQFGFGWALILLLIYYVIQICENNLLVPLIMKHSVGLSPIAIMFGMLVGVSFPDTIHPVVGILLAVPTTAIITIFVQDLYVLQKSK